MLVRFGDLDRTVSLMDEVRRRMDRVWEDLEGGVGPFSSGLWPASAFPRVNLWDAGNQLVLKADVPGISEKNLQISLHGESLALSGERKSEAPEGYSVHRKERSAYRFSRSVALPCKVNSEQVSAQIKDGVLTIILPKTPEAQPRQISVKTQ